MRSLTVDILPHTFIGYFVLLNHIFILMWQKTPCLYRREMNATSTEFTQVIEVDNRT